MSINKASDIPDEEILRILATLQGTWASHFWGPLAEAYTAVPYKILLAKLRQLHKRGFVGGCTCGCRGDWEITDAGLAFIGTSRTKPYNGYGERK